MIELCCEYLSVQCIYLTVCSYNIRYAFQSESSLARKFIWQFWRNGWLFLYELSFCGVEFSCSHLKFKFHACFKQGVPWHSGNYRVWILSETGTWHNKNIQLYKSDMKTTENSYKNNRSMQRNPNSAIWCIC